MARVLLGGLIVAIIAAVVAYKWFDEQQATHQSEEAKIAQLQDQVLKLQDENLQLKTALGKVQGEEARLVTENQALTKAIEQARLTGKLPKEFKLPYPPK